MQKSYGIFYEESTALDVVTVRRRPMCHTDRLLLLLLLQ